MTFTPRVVVFIGVETRDVLQPATIVAKRIKYNEDTGQPYEVEEAQTGYTLFGRPLEKTNRRPIVCVEDLIAKLATPLETFGETECPGTYIGLRLDEVDVDNSCEATLSELTDKFAAAAAAFKELGYEGPLRQFALLYYV
jgi:hypothetical protein